MQVRRARTPGLPDFGDLGEFRNLSGAAWEIDLSSERKFDLRLSVENEYESDASGDSKRNDLRYWGGLVLGF